MSSNVSALGLLLFMAALVGMLTRRLRLPYTVGLVLAGIGLALLPVHFDLRLSKDLIFFGFLPPLVFEAGLYIKWAELRRDLPVVGLLATLGVLLAAAVTSAGMHYAVNWAWGSAIVFGVLIAATDPVSVIATFKDAGARGRLRLLVEAESLLNDGTAAVLFVAALQLSTGAAVSLGVLFIHLAVSICGGILCGIIIGTGFKLLAGRTSDPLIAITFTTLAAYGSFFCAERLHLSGVLAALAAGLVTGNWRGTSTASAVDAHTLRSFWEYGAFVANSLIFLLIGAQVAEQRFAGLWLAIPAAIGFVTLGRAVAIYPVCGLFARSTLKVAWPHQHILFWGGLRGALALALALGLPAGLAHREAIVSVAFGVVAFSIFVQGLTMTPLLHRLSPTRFSRTHPGG